MDLAGCANPIVSHPPQRDELQCIKKYGKLGELLALQTKPEDDETIQVFLVGLLFQFWEAAIDDLKKPNADADLSKMRELNNYFKLMVPAEISLLESFLYLNDNIRDLDTALASQELGELYLLSLRHFLLMWEKLCLYENNDPIKGAISKL